MSGDETAGELSGSTKDPREVSANGFTRGRPVHTVLSFSPASSAAWIQVLRFNMVGGFAKGVQIHNPCVSEV